MYKRQLGRYLRLSRLARGRLSGCDALAGSGLYRTEGLAPEEVERYVTYPIESAMAGLPKLKNMRSVSNFGLSVVNIYFEDGTDVYFARQVVGERLSQARGNIPDGFGDPKMGPISTGLGIILYFRLDDATGTRSLVEMREIQDWIIKYQLQTCLLYTSPSPRD